MEVGIDELKSLVIGIIGGIIVLVAHKAYSAYRRRSVLSDIEMLSFEKEHLEAMKRSSVEMNRSAFRGLFLILAIMSLAQILSIVIGGMSSGISLWLIPSSPLFLWVISFAASLKMWRRYSDLKDMKAAIHRIDQRMEKLSSKL